MNQSPRVAIIGNMNNNSNNLIRYLMDQGLDCTLLFYANEASHFVPDADNIDAVSYPHATLSWGGYRQLFTTPASTIAADLAPFDFLIGSRLAPAYARKAGRALDIFMPTGGDLHMLPMFSGFAPKDFVKYLFYSRLQRLGIQQSKTLFWDVTNTELEEKIEPVVRGMDRISHAIPAIYYPDYRGEALERRLQHSEWLDQFSAARSDCDFLFLHHVKQVWLPKTIRYYGEFHDKGNDQIVHGLAEYYAGKPTKRIKVAMIRFGTDYDETEALAQRLGVAEHIVWFPQLPRKELMMAISVVDAVIGEVTRSWFSYGTIMEAMVMGKTVLHNRDDALYPTKRLYPMLRIFDGPSVAEAFRRIAAGEVDLSEMGRGAHQWLVEYGMGEPVGEITQRIRAKG
jgi:hypothetical protein